MSEASWTRQPAVSGQFYPQDSDELARVVVSFLEEKRPSPAKAVIVPHAGYVYSGAIAGSAYRLVTVPSTVVILCPNHTGRGAPISVWSQGSWQTPLGTIKVDESFASKLIQDLGGLAEEDTQAHEFEHAIEVHLPFLHILNPTVQIVPIVLGNLRKSECLLVGAALARAMRVTSTPPLLVASTDMSHYISADEAQEKDSLAMSCIEQKKPEKLYDTVLRNEISMCGYVPTTVVLAACQALGIESLEKIRYGNSGEVSGDFGSVVAYASYVIR